MWKLKNPTASGGQSRQTRRTYRNEAEDVEGEEVIQSKPMVKDVAPEPTDDVHDSSVENERELATPCRPERLDAQETPAAERMQPTDHLDSTRRDSNYVPSDSPHSSRELRTTPYQKQG